VIRARAAALLPTLPVVVETEPPPRPNDDQAEKEQDVVTDGEV